MDARLEQLLQRERQVRPEPGAEERIWSAVEHRLTHGPPPPSGAEVAPGAGGATAAKGIVLKIAAGVALVAAAVGIAAATRDTGPSGARPEVPAVAVEHVSEDRPVAEPAAAVAEPAIAAAGDVAAPEEPPEPALVETSPEEPPVQEPKRRSRARAKAGDDPPATTAEPGPEDFAAELQLIAEIRGALKRGDSARALAGVSEHVRRFGARGQLVQERMAYHVEALCAAGRTGEARRVAGDLLARWPDSTHAPRVKQSCAGA